MNYGLPLLSLILYICKPNVDCMELSFHSHTISHLTKNQALIYISIFEVSNFLLKIALQCFLLTNRTIVFFELLPSLWQSSTSFLVIAIFIAPKTSITFSSNFSSGICGRMPWISILLKCIARTFNFSELFLQQFNFISQLSIILF